MSLQPLLVALDRALREWNPRLAIALNPGLKGARIRSALRKHGFENLSDDLVDLYGWRNGTPLTPEVVAPKLGMFPGPTPYYFLDLEMALGHMGHARAAAKKHPKLLAVADCLPLFWDGSQRWLAIDCGLGHSGRVIAVDHRRDPPMRVTDASLHLFLARAIDAMQSGEALRLAKEE